MVKPESGVTLMHYQTEQTNLTYIFLYVDRPELLAAALTKAQGYNQVSP